MLQISFEEECGRCYGNGTSFSDWPKQTSWATKIECPRCKGVGMQLTESGRTIIELVRKHLKLGEQE